MGTKVTGKVVIYFIELVLAHIFFQAKVPLLIYVFRGYPYMKHTFLNERGHTVQSCYYLY
jgi:hypothetical protein